MADIVNFIGSFFCLLFMYIFIKIYFYILSFFTYLSLARTWHVNIFEEIGDMINLMPRKPMNLEAQSLSLCICILFRRTDLVSRNFDLRDWSREGVNWTVSDITYWLHTLCDVCRYTCKGAHRIFRMIETMQVKTDPIHTVFVHTYIAWRFLSVNLLRQVCRLFFYFK